ncbi:MAG: class I SAM-dependent methyltransferase [Acidimicrobiales bacterium]
MTSESDSPFLRTAREHADVGLPVERVARFRLLKRILYRVSWVFLRHQVAFNHAVLGEVAALRTERAATLAALDNRFELAFRQVLDELGDHVARSTDEHVRLAQELAELSSRVEPLSPLAPVVEDLAARVAREASAMHLARAEAAVVVERVRRALPPSDFGRREDLPSAWDDLYLPFEDVFRGSPELIQSRLSAYLPDVARLERGDRPVVDVGCGRGDWLALLAAEGVRAYGVDNNLRSIERAQERGLDARHGDAMVHLAEVPAGSLAAVTVFHLVEHVTIEQLVELLDLSYRALMPGGLLILETPNPDNLLVGTSNFYLDPTHRNPLPPALLAFLVGSRGFRDTDVRPLRRGTLEPASPSALATLDPAVAAIVELLQEHLLAGEDYAVLAYR